MKRLVMIVQVLAVACVAVFLVLLFANEPDKTTATSTSSTATSASSGPVDGAEIYKGRCAGCHGQSGGGGVGPKLSEGHVVARFPNIADHIAVIHDGRGSMPAFGESLTDEQIRAVAEYERSL